MASDAKATPPKAKHRITLTRAALYILEGCLQEDGPCTTPAKTVLWAKVWDKIRAANDRRVKTSWMKIGHDFEKTILRDEGESDASFTRRNVEWKEATAAWEDETLTITMNDKMRDTCRETVKWIHDHRDDPKVSAKLRGKHAAMLLVALDICKAEPDEDLELDVDEGIAEGMLADPGLKAASASA